jgi:hypothetical protein
VRETRATGRSAHAHLSCGMVPGGEVVPCLGDCGILVSGANGAGDGDSVRLEGAGNTDVFSVLDLGSLACGGMPTMVDGLPIAAPVVMLAATEDNEYRAQDKPSNAGTDGALLGSLHISTGGTDTVCQMDLSTLNSTSPNYHQQFSFNAHPEISLHHNGRNTYSSLPLNSYLKGMFSYQPHDLDGNSAVSDSFTKVSRAGLQALCKKFNIRANMKNVEMAHALSLLAQTDEQVLVALQELLVSLSLTQRAKKKTVKFGRAAVQG